MTLLSDFYFVPVILWVTLRLFIIASSNLGGFGFFFSFLGLKTHPGECSNPFLWEWWDISWYVVVTPRVFSKLCSFRLLMIPGHNSFSALQERSQECPVTAMKLCTDTVQMTSMVRTFWWMGTKGWAIASPRKSKGLSSYMQEISLMT